MLVQLFEFCFNKYYIALYIICVKHEPYTILPVIHYSSNFIFSFEILIDSSDKIEYPYETSRGITILHNSIDTLSLGIDYSMAAYLQKRGQIKLTLENGSETKSWSKKLYVKFE
ncbi:MAG: hypothetical protein JW894_02980 [Bacteroidales bacterium]|nr:hypothetical protein [Bacteroidales bacterium]